MSSFINLLFISYFSKVTHSWYNVAVYKILYNRLNLLKALEEF